jgi:hypothetical protein
MELAQIQNDLFSLLEVRSPERQGRSTASHCSQKAWGLRRASGNVGERQSR